MKSKESFVAFYENELKSPIENLETRRKSILDKYSYKKYKRNLKWMAFVCLGIIIAGQAVPEKLPTQIIYFVPFTVGYSIVAAIYILIMRMRTFKPMKQEYKQSVIPKIISFVDPKLDYKPEAGISREEFDRGGLFGRSCLW